MPAETDIFPAMTISNPGATPAHHEFLLPSTDPPWVLIEPLPTETCCAQCGGVFPADFYLSNDFGMYTLAFPASTGGATGESAGWTANFAVDWGTCASGRQVHVTAALGCPEYRSIDGLGNPTTLPVWSLTYSLVGCGLSGSGPGTQLVKTVYAEAAGCDASGGLTFPDPGTSWRDFNGALHTVPSFGVGTVTT